MIKDREPPNRYRAVGIVKGGETQVLVARELDIDVATIKCRLPATDQERHSRIARRSPPEVSLEPSGGNRDRKVYFKRHHSTRGLS